jgi:hypothetical protein
MVGFNWPTHPLLSYTVLPAIMAFGLRNKDQIGLGDYVHPSALVAAGTGILSGVGLWWLGRKFDFNPGLDVISMELEYFGNPYVNSLNTTKFDNQPIPLSSYGGEKSDVYKNFHVDDWKWSVYARKSFTPNISFMGQIARDHIRWYRLDYVKMDGKAALPKKDNWYYTFKFSYAF